MTSQTSHRIGHGYDLHRLEPLPPEGDGRPFILGGIHIEHDRGPVGHSDGDALLHAVTDAILGALGEPDIGQLFPDNDPDNDGRDSIDFLNEAVSRMQARDWCIANIDITIICERPKISPHKHAMRNAIAAALHCASDAVNIKGKTHEQVDATGEGRAIQVHAVTLLQRNTPTTI